MQKNLQGETANSNKSDCLMQLELFLIGCHQLLHMQITVVSFNCLLINQNRKFFRVQTQPLGKRRMSWMTLVTKRIAAVGGKNIVTEITIKLCSECLCNCLLQPYKTVLLISMSRERQIISNSNSILIFSLLKFQNIQYIVVVVENR